MTPNGTSKPRPVIPYRFQGAESNVQTGAFPGGVLGYLIIFIELILFCVPPPKIVFENFENFLSSVFHPVINKHFYFFQSPKLSKLFTPKRQITGRENCHRSFVATRSTSEKGADSIKWQKVAFPPPVPQIASRCVVRTATHSWAAGESYL